jgi:glycosyltransferase involved in cell wall biosynthesis
MRVMNEISVLKDHYEIYILCTGKASKPKTGFEDVHVEYVNVEEPLEKFRFISSSTNSLFKTHWANLIQTFVEKHKVDIIHAHDLYMLPACNEVKRNTGLPLIIDLHENYPEAFRTYSWTKKFPHKLFVNYHFWDKIQKELLTDADGIIVLSAPFEAFLKKEFSRDRAPEFALYPNVPDVDFYKGQKTEKTKESKVFKLFYLGVVGYSRGLHVASKAVEILNKDGYNVELHIAGKVHKNDLEYFQEEVMKENVVHIEWINLEELGNYLSEMDAGISPIFKNPQHESGIANKVYQYMLFAKPILVSNCKPQQELVEEFNCGLVHEDQDPTDFAEKVKWFLVNKAETETMGENGKNAILEKYNLDEMGKNILNLYRDILHH